MKLDDIPGFEKTPDSFKNNAGCFEIAQILGLNSLRDLEDVTDLAKMLKKLLDDRREIIELILKSRNIIEKCLMEFYCCPCCGKDLRPGNHADDCGLVLYLTKSGKTVEKITGKSWEELTE